MLLLKHNNTEMYERQRAGMYDVSQKGNDLVSACVQTSAQSLPAVVRVGNKSAMRMLYGVLARRRGVFAAERVDGGADKRAVVG